MIFIKEKTSSVQQFSKDFLEYPPSPLNGMKENTKFNVIRTGYLGDRFYVISRLIKSLRSKNKKAFQLLSAYDVSFSNSLDNMKKSLDELKSSYITGSALGKIFFLVFIFTISPLMLITFLLYISFLFIRTPRKKLNNAFGFYNPAFQDEREIVIYPGNIKKSGYDCNHIISHEHIHLIQNKCFPDRYLEEKRNAYKVRLASLLDKDFTRRSFIEYLFDINEAEARLHEVVYSYYRVNKNLPLTYHSFIKLLIGADKIGPFVFSFIKQHDKSYLDFEFSNYPVIDSIGIDQLIDMLISFSNNESSYRFICEVLPVMYGNLLVIYGDSDSSKKYMKTIPSIELYEYLYGAL